MADEPAATPIESPTPTTTEAVAATPAVAPAAPAVVAPAVVTPAPAIATGVVDPAAPTTVTTPADWPADWRDKLAALKPGDKKFRERLDRFASVSDVGKSWLSLEERMSSGELKQTRELPKDATPEQVEAWRKEQGLPAKPEDYVSNLKLTDGIVPGEADKPLLDAVGKMALSKGYKQDAVNDFVSLYYDLQDQLTGQREMADQDFRIATEQTLLREMGPDFKRNMNALASFWREQPEGTDALILNSRTADGRRLGDMPEVVNHYARLALERNPAAALLPPGTTDNVKAIGDRKVEIEKTMYLSGKPNPAYWNNESVRKEYRDLIDAETQLKRRVG